VRGTVASFLLCAAPLLSAAVGHAETEKGSTFVGKLGAVDVVACLDLASMTGRYYYLKYGKTMMLEAHETKTGVLIEYEASRSPGDLAAEWRVRQDGGKLVGTWTQKGKKPLTIDLRQTAGGCADFESRRMDVPDRKSVASEAPSAQVAFSRHGLADVTRLLLVGGAPQSVLGRINEVLDKHFRDRVAESFDCAEYTETVDVEIYREMLLADYESGYFCGGVHPNEGYSVRAFDLRDGKEIDEGSTWVAMPKGGAFRLSEAKDGLGALLSRAYMAVMSQAYGEDVDVKECLDALAPAGYWPTGQGLTFRLWSDARSAVECRQDVTLPYATVRPFVRPEHRQAFDTWSKLLEAQKPVSVRDPRTVAP
jgi:hypothetical protein